MNREKDQAVHDALLTVKTVRQVAHEAPDYTPLGCNRPDVFRCELMYPAGRDIWSAFFNPFTGNTNVVHVETRIPGGLLDEVHGYYSRKDAEAIYRSLVSAGMLPF